MIDVKVKTFLTLMEEKSTIQCAEVLHITQPAVTQHIRALEKEYEVKLSNRWEIKFDSKMRVIDIDD